MNLNQDWCKALVSALPLLLGSALSLWVAIIVALVAMWLGQEWETAMAWVLILSTAGAATVGIGFGMYVIHRGVMPRAAETFCRGDSEQR